MQQYISNLWMALTGNNPYKAELDEKYEKAAENVAGLNDLYYKSIEAFDNVEKHADVLEQQLKQVNGEKQSLQQLVENLRERISDKERELDQQGKDFRARMERMKADYQRRIGEYTREIDRLKNTKQG